MRRVAFLALALLVLLTASSCKLWDILFFKAPGVSPKDLAAYTGTLPTTRDEALMTIGIGGELAVMSSAEHVAASSAWDSAFPKGMSKAFSAIQSLQLLEPFFAAVKAKSISITQSGMTDSSLAKEVHIDIENEPVSVSGQSGTLTIDTFTADMTASLTAPSPPFSGEGEAEVDCLVTASNLKNTSYSSTVTVNSAKLGAKAKGTLSFAADGTIDGPTSLEYNIAADAKLGFSISDTSPGHFSGKFIIEANYVDSGSYTKAQLTDPTGTYFSPSAAISKLEVTIKIKVYNNDNDLVNEYELDQDDFSSIMR